ncbi:hypothetical protein Dsin_025234 [Dipteronia sinensis]|uniref:Uncharacterized protein n=1 Tax=Dipteronia sinensis TaxID=43782 RepID=A0AAE0DY60_9ROSI|nr:hypothetical protein Dsin_025234 [Dipteronia sinensis]
MTKFSITNHDIKLLHLEDLLKNNKTANDDFKVTFCLHMLGTVLASAAREYVDASYLTVLADVGNIYGKNWIRWCFDQLVISIEKLQSKSARYIDGCVLFLEVSISEYTPPAAPSDNSDKAKHDNLPDDVLHMVVKEIQQLRTEYADLKYKVDHLYETIIVNKDDEVAHLKEKSTSWMENLTTVTVQNRRILLSPEKNNTAHHRTFIVWNQMCLLQPEDTLLKSPLRTSQ